ATVVAHQDMVVSPSKTQAQVDCRDLCTDIETADMDEAAEAFIAGKLGKKLTVPRKSKHVSRAHFDERSALLLEQHRQCPDCFVPPGRFGEAHLAAG